MLYLGDYLELIEHLPQELKYKLTEMRQLDLQVHNTTDRLDDETKQFFKSIESLEPEMRQKQFERIVAEYLEAVKYCDEKVQMAKQMYDLVERLSRRLDGELNKFKLELEADHAGITEELEARSYELDNIDSCMSPPPASSNMGGPSASKRLRQFSLGSGKAGMGKVERRRSYQKSASHSTSTSPRSAIDEYDYDEEDDSEHHQSRYRGNRLKNQRGRSFGARHVQRPRGARSGTSSGPGSIVGEPDLGNQILGALSREFASRTHASSSARVSNEHREKYSGKLSGNSMPFANDTSGTHSAQSVDNKQSSGSSFASQHSALSSALASAPTAYSTSNQTATSLAALMNGKSHHLSHSLSPLNGSRGASSTATQPHLSSAHKGPSNSSQDPGAMPALDPIVAAASQAIAATQQMQVGRRTSSLKASYAAINNGLGSTLDFSKDNHSNSYKQRNPTSHSISGKSGNPPSTTVPPLYISVTKSGRMTKRPRHTLNYYRDESPTSHHHHHHYNQHYEWATSNTSNQSSVFADNSESMLSTDLSDSGTTMFESSSSPASPDFSSGAGVVGGGGTATTGAYQKDDTKYCICRRVSYGAMVACDYAQCEYEWFHYGCVGITAPPKGKWFCPDCTKKLATAHGQHKKRGRKPSYLKQESHNLNHHLQHQQQAVIVGSGGGEQNQNLQHQPINF